MPAITTITCDVCGEEAESYPSFFRVIDSNEHEYVNHPTVPAVLQRAPTKLVVDTTGVIRHPAMTGSVYGHMRVCLCPAHFAALQAACEEWLTSALTS